MNKAAARIASVAKILGDVCEPFRGKIRVAAFYDDEPIPITGPDEELILIHVLATPDHRPAPCLSPSPDDGRPGRDDGGNGHGDADLAAEVERLQAVRDALKQAKASEKKTRSRPRAAAISDRFRGGLKGGA